MILKHSHPGNLSRKSIDSPSWQYIASQSLIPSRYIIIFAAVLAMSVSEAVNAASFPLPTDGDNIVGDIQVITIANPDTTLLDIARDYDLGFEEITRVNPDVPVWVPKLGRRVIIPTEFILPPGPQEGVVVNIPQRRLFYFPKPAPQQQAQVITFPISIAREGWRTPLGQSRIVAKHRDPSWFVPKSILEEHRSDGETEFPTYFPPGPDNPMGMLALETGFPGIYIHGTNMPWGVGMRTSHGCLHLYPEDAAQLFPIIPVGTPVRIIDEPITIGVRDGTLYLSSSKPLSEYHNELPVPTRALSALVPYTEDSGSAHSYADVDWQRAYDAAMAHQILPVPISQGAPGMEDQIAAVKPQPYENEPYGPDANAAAPPIILK